MLADYCAGGLKALFKDANCCGSDWTFVNATACESMRDNYKELCPAKTSCPAEFDNHWQDPTRRNPGIGFDSTSASCDKSTCPDNWELRGGKCHHPGVHVVANRGQCDNPSKFSDYGATQKRDWATMCGTAWTSCTQGIGTEENMR